jgi:hypothetical protein
MQPPSKGALIRTMRRHAALIVFSICLAFGASTTCSGQYMPTQSNQTLEFARPNADGGPTIIRVLYFIINLRNIDSARQTFEVDIFYRLRWHDPRLRAEPGASGVRKLPIDAVWRPEVGLWNSSNVKSIYAKMVEVDPEGNVTYRQRIDAVLDSTFNLRDFPFDRQELAVRAASLLYTPEEVKFVADKGPSGMFAGLDLPEWRLSAPRLETAPMELRAVGMSRAAITILILAKRKSAYYIQIFLFPMFLILAMAYAVLWIEPGQFGPQIGVCTGAIFSFIAFRFSISLLLPRISYFTRMDQFVFGATLLVFVPLAKAVVTSRLIKAERIGLVQNLDLWSRLVYPVLVAALTLLTLRVGG